MKYQTCFNTNSRTCTQNLSNFRSVHIFYLPTFTIFNNILFLLSVLCYFCLLCFQLSNLSRRQYTTADIQTILVSTVCNNMGFNILHVQPDRKTINRPSLFTSSNHVNWRFIPPPFLLFLYGWMHFFASKFIANMQLWFMYIRSLYTGVWSFLSEMLQNSSNNSCDKLNLP